MKHLTDEQLREFWLEGPADKESYLKLLLHLNECTVCRDRCWDSLLEYRQTTNAVSTALDKLAEAFEKSMGQGKTPDGKKLPAGLQFLGSFDIPKGSSMESLIGGMPSDNALATMLLGLAAKRINAVPEDVALTSELIFGHEKFDDLAHFARCETCHGRMKLMHKITNAALTHPEINSKPDIRKDLTRLNAWLANQLTKIQMLQEKQKSEPEEASGPATECKVRSFHA